MEETLTGSVFEGGGGARGAEGLGAGGDCTGIAPGGAKFTGFSVKGDAATEGTPGFTIAGKGSGAVGAAAGAAVAGTVPAKAATGGFVAFDGDGAVAEGGGAKETGGDLMGSAVTGFTAAEGSGAK